MRNTFLTPVILSVVLSVAPCVAAEPFPAAAISAAIKKAESIVNAQGYAAFMDQMFVSDSEIMVQSEEFFPVFYGRDQVTAYFKPPTENLYAHREVYSNIEGTLLRPGLALVTWHNRYDMQAVGRLPVGGWSRMVAVMRKVGDDWKFVSLVQSPMSLISQARRIQEEAVSPDFVEYARKQNPDYDALIAADKRIASRRAGLPWISGGGNTQENAERNPATPGSGPPPSSQPSRPVGP